MRLHLSHPCSYMESLLTIVLYVTRWKLNSSPTWTLVIESLLGAIIGFPSEGGDMCHALGKASQNRHSKERLKISPKQNLQARQTSNPGALCHIWSSWWDNLSSKGLEDSHSSISAAYSTFSLYLGVDQFCTCIFPCLSFHSPHFYNIFRSLLQIRICFIFCNGLAHFWRDSNPATHWLSLEGL